VLADQLGDFVFQVDEAAESGLDGGFLIVP
jgi:hypothetical protein